MRISQLLVLSCVCTLLGCSSMKTSNQPSQTVVSTPPIKSILTTPKKKDPIEVSFFPAGKNPTLPYTVIGEAAVSRFNDGGIKRQDAVIHDAMRTAAASMGGDAIIDVKRTNDAVIGKIVIWQPKVVV